MSTEEKWNGTERREYCAQHCAIAKASKESTPRWVWAPFLVIALAFAGWHVASLRSIKLEVDARLQVIEVGLDKKIAEQRELYYRDVQAFFNVAIENKKLLTDLNSKVSDIKTQVTSQGKVQDLILKKVKISE